MDVYNKLTQYPVFAIDEVAQLTGNLKTAYYQVERLMQKGLVQKIRKNIYSAVNPISDHIIATRYQIACAITKTAYISHYSAFEYHGITKRIQDEVYVSSETKFNSFEHERAIYKYVASKMKAGVVEPQTKTDVRVTNIERTVIDSINDYNKTGGFIQLINCLSRIHRLDESRLLEYLAGYNTQALYQRVGFLLKHYQENMELSNAFIRYCKGKIGKSRQYLLKGSVRNRYNSEWELMVPENLLAVIQRGRN